MNKKVVLYIVIPIFIGLFSTEELTDIHGRIHSSMYTMKASAHTRGKNYIPNSKIRLGVIQNMNLPFVVKNNPGYLILDSRYKLLQAVHPDILYFPHQFRGYRYYMAFTPYPYGNQVYENPCLSVSNDGLHFDTLPGLHNPIVPAPVTAPLGGHNSDTDIIFVNNKLVMHYVYNVVGKKGPAEFYRIESADGIHWSTPELVFKGEDNVITGSPAFINDNGIIRMWYLRGEGVLAYAVSNDDEKTWTNPVICSVNLGDWKVWHLDIIKYDNKYIGLICARYKNTKRRDLFYTESYDGINWLTSEEPILSPIKKGWDNLEIYRSTLAFVNNRIKIWYSAHGRDNTWHIAAADVRYKMH